MQYEQEINSDIIELLDELQAEQVDDTAQEPVVYVIDPISDPLFNIDDLEVADLENFDDTTVYDNLNLENLPEAATNNTPAEHQGSSWFGLKNIFNFLSNSSAETSAKLTSDSSPVAQANKATILASQVLDIGRDSYVGLSPEVAQLKAKLNADLRVLKLNLNDAVKWHAQSGEIVTLCKARVIENFQNGLKMLDTEHTLKISQSAMDLKLALDGPHGLKADKNADFTVQNNLDNLRTEILKTVDGTAANIKDNVNILIKLIQADPENKDTHLKDLEKQKALLDVTTNAEKIADSFAKQHEIKQEAAKYPSTNETGNVDLEHAKTFDLSGLQKSGFWKQMPSSLNLDKFVKDYHDTLHKVANFESSVHDLEQQIHSIETKLADLSMQHHDFDLAHYLPAAESMHMDSSVKTTDGFYQHNHDSHDMPDLHDHHPEFS